MVGYQQTDFLDDQLSLHESIIGCESEISEIQIQFPIGLSRSAAPVAFDRGKQRTSDLRMIPHYGKQGTTYNDSLCSPEPPSAGPPRKRVCRLPVCHLPAVC